jgi:hypothetical protein
MPIWTIREIITKLQISSIKEVPRIEQYIIIGLGKRTVIVVPLLS